MQKRDLDNYARTLKQYVSPEIREYSPIGRRKIPKPKQQQTQSVVEARESLQERLGIGWRWDYKGRWILEMQGLDDNPGNLSGEDLYYWGIMPINSGNKSFLEYLAKNSFPKLFRGKRFSVRDTMIACNGDCSWDCT